MIHPPTARCPTGTAVSVMDSWTGFSPKSLKITASIRNIFVQCNPPQGVAFSSQSIKTSWNNNVLIENKQNAMISIKNVYTVLQRKSAGQNLDAKRIKNLLVQKRF